jgi:uncharacterized protein
MNYQQYIPLIVEELKKAEPEKIILFGSYAYGQPNDDSDLDIIVVTQEDITPISNHDKMKIHHKFNKYLKVFRQQIPIDLIVYTKSMYEKLENSENSFFAEINQKGKVLYEANDKRMA